MASTTAFPLEAPPPSLSACIRSVMALDAASLLSCSDQAGNTPVRLFPTFEQLTHWLREAQHRLTCHRSALGPGAPERLYVATSLEAEALGTGFALMGDWEMARCYWRRACQYGLQPLQLTQGVSSDDLAHTAGVGACEALRLVVCALAAGDANMLQQILQYEACADRMPLQALDELAVSVLQALQAFMTGQVSMARQMLQIGIGHLPGDPALAGCYQGLVNMAWALSGVLNCDQETFTAGVMGQLAVHYQWALCRGSEVEDAYICLSALAMVNLGLRHGLKQQVFDLLIPQGLIPSR